MVQAQRGTNPDFDPAQWLTRHGDALYRFARARTGRDDLAEDLVQETLLAAWSGRKQFAGRSTERTWLVGILRHKINDYFRDREPVLSAAPLTEEGSEEATFFDDRGEWAHPYSSDAVLCNVEEAGLWRTFAECVRALPAPLQEAFTLRELTDLPAEEVASTLSLSVAHLYVLLHRGRMRLRLCLEAAWFCSE